MRCKMQSTKQDWIPTKSDALNLLLYHPASFGRMVGFNKLTDELHNKWLKKMILTTEDKTLQGHRESYKTTCLSVALAILMIINPNDRILFMRKTDDDVKEVIQQVANILKKPHTKLLVNAIYGVDLKLPEESATKITTNLTNSTRGSSQLVGKGIGASLTGSHYEIIFTDDIVNLVDRYSRAEREKTKRIYDELQNLRNRGGRFFNTGTPWHKDDAFTKMPPAEKYDCYATGLMSPDQIQQKRDSMDASLFSANYELKHIASEDVLFSNPTINADATLLKDAQIVHIDASYGGSDYTALTIGRKKDGKYYIFGKLWHKHIDDCIDDIIAYRKQFLAYKIYCEDNGDKGYLAKDLKNRGEKAVKYHESENKFIKITSFVKPVWKDIEFVEGTDADYINQVTEFNENAEHDDAPDSLACTIRLLKAKKERTEEDMAKYLEFL